MNAAAIQMSVPRMSALAQVEAGLLYLEPTAGKPRSLEFEPPPGVPQTTAVYRERKVAIHDVRPLAATLSLDEQGFRLLTAPASLENFDTEEAITSQYYDETIALLQEVTGASRVVVFDHTIRRRIAGVSDRSCGFPRQPVPRVHVDYTVKSGPQRLREVLPEEAPELLKKRFAVINVWRPIKGPIEDSPLAVSDARSVANQDLIATDLVYPNRTGEIYYVKFNPAHEWFYAPAMRDDEVMLIKCYDSLDDGRARFVPHSAFVDPTTPANALPRQSIELRTLVFY
jgi:hypothetical protein